MGQPAQVIQFPRQAEERKRLPDVIGRAQGEGRLMFAEKLEELAQKIRSGELDGASAEWRDNWGNDTRMRTVTIDRAKGEVQLLETHIEER